MYTFIPNRRYSFTTLAPSVLGGTRTAVKIKAVLDYSFAIKYDAVSQKARIVYPHLPSGTPEDPTHYTYLLIERIEGQTEVLAYEWIDINSVTTSDAVTLTVTVPVASIEDSIKIRDTLTLLGYSGFTIKTQALSA